jgi:molecular chaperone DnaJ
MNRKEAYSHLGVSEDCSPDQLKNAFRKLAKQYHPDNKETGNEAKFKQINEAYNRITNNDFPQENPFAGNPFAGNPFGGFAIDDMFSTFFGNSPFGRNQHVAVNPIEVTLNIPYEISVKGGKASINVARNKKCTACNGKGGTQSKSACTGCAGTGTKNMRMGNIVVSHPCNQCGGKKTPLDKCSTCNGSKVTNETVTIKLDIPPGITTGHTLKISNAGNWCANQHGHDIISDVHVRANVATHEKFTTRGNDVHSTVNIKLLDALKGCYLTVDTVYGEAKVDVPSRTKHGDRVQIKNQGVGNKGNHVVTLNVDYPGDVSELVKVLS